MLKIDFHTHCFPDAIAARTMELLSEKASIANYYDGTISGLEHWEQEGGSDGFVVLPISTNPKQTSSVNRFAEAIQNESAHMYAFGSVHPENEDYREQIASIKAMNLRGIKLHPEYQNFHVNDPTVFPIYEEIFKHSLPLIFHAGEDLGYKPPWHSEPHKIAEVARRYPEATIIAAHLGGYKMLDEALECLTHLPNVYADTSFLAGRLPADEFQRICGAWGFDRLLFGSDGPWNDISSSIVAVDGLRCSERERELIFSGNALRIMKVGKDIE